MMKGVRRYGSRSRATPKFSTNAATITRGNSVQAATVPMARGRARTGSRRLRRAKVNVTFVDESRPPSSPARGVALLRTQLAEYVWGGDYDPLSNLADVYVGYIRRKLQAADPRPLIQTVRGLGYMLKHEDVS